MGDPNDTIKNTSIGYRANDLEKETVKRLANTFTRGDQATLLRHLVAAACDALDQHGERVIWPPKLNHYPAGTKTAQDEIKPKE